MNVSEEIEDNISVTDLEEKKEEVVPEPETKQITIDPLAEIESNIGETLVLNV
jgi:hypothetical protein